MVTFMNKTLTREAIPAVAGKSISSAFVLKESREAHGVLLVFADGTELTVNFNHETRVGAEILLYRWDGGEATMLDQTTGT